ncbi:hypothetical protein BJX70DRAFT_399268 [Aspergillus crustosus]
MSNPLSPLADTRQNSRALSSDYEDITGKRGQIDRLLNDNMEGNPLFSPEKAVGDERGNFRQSFGYDDASYEVQIQENDDDSVNLLDVQSSPFRFDARDDTVDMQMLQKHQASLEMKACPATSKKRSYDQAPDVHDTDFEESERYKKSLDRKDAPDISIYADEDSGSRHDQSLGDNAGHIAGSIVEERQHEGMSTVLRENNQDTTAGDRDNLDADNTKDVTYEDDSHDFMDDTCLSTFSAVPNVDMTAFANLRGGSPFKSPRPLPSRPVDDDDTSPNGGAPGTPATAQRSSIKNILFDMSSPITSPTPKKRDMRDSQPSSGTPNLLDLTDQSFFPRRQRYSVQQHVRYSPRQSPLRNPRGSIRSPAKISLLDFDIPAAPTPRSIPTITPRELESLKSGFLSEISSLRATLSGKEAEVSSLKKAVSDAERRVGEALEEVRNEASRKENLEIEQAEWQRRGREMEEVLRSVKTDILEGEQERERLQKKNEETEKGKEQLESRIVELGTQLATARKSATCGHGPSESTTPSATTAKDTAKEIQDAVEKVARDLHTLYKEKHESKVAALKKSYEARWERRLRDADKKLKVSRDENERLRAERDAAMQESARPDASMIPRESEEQEAKKRILEAQVKGLQQEMVSLRTDSEQLHLELKAERAEKGDLVALVEEWLSMQNPPAPSTNSNPRTQEATPEPVPQEQPLATEDLEREVTHSNPTGLRGPSSSSSASSNQGERKIPRFGAPASRHIRGNSGGKSGIAVFTPGRSAIMGSIERMGRGGSAS